MKKILVFGGSFDPIHYGHLQIVKNALVEFNFDKCIFLPALKPRWKELSSSSLDRLKMLEIMLKGEINCEISHIELNSNVTVNYTYDSLKVLKEKENGEYYLLVGADQINQIDKWYRINDLIKICRIIGYNRKNYPLNNENIAKYNISLIKGSYIDISSTEIRNFKKLYTKKEVLDYIAEHDLYYIEKIKKYFDEKRFKHSLSVADLAYEIALSNKLDAHLAYQAGLIHDIAKNLDSDVAYNMMKEYYPDYVKYEVYTYHQFLAKIILQKDFNIDNEELFSAITYHCTGCNEMSKMAKVIYVSDKIEPTRGYDSTELIALCLKDIDNGFKEVLKENKIYLEKNFKSQTNSLEKECYEKYL